MEIKRETSVFLETSDGKILERGNMYAFETKDRTFCGKYVGIDRKGSIEFKGIIGKVPVSFHVMPKSIIACYECDVKILRREE